MSNSHYDDVFTVTLENRTKSLADNVSKNNALLKRLNEKGKIRKISGGFQNFGRTGIRRRRFGLVHRL